MHLLILLLVFIGLAVVLAWFLISNDHGEKEPVAALWKAVCFGLVGALAAAWLENRFISAGALAPSAPYRPMLAMALSVGVIEETCKFVPLALFIYKRRYFNEHTDGVIYFALAGLGFGLPENILYSAQFGSKIGLARVLLTPLFHAATTGTVGYFLVKRKLAGKSPFGVLLPLAAVMVLHGLYDFGLLSGSVLYSSGAILITLGLSAGLFVTFLRANEHDQDKGLSVVGHNAFCRSCGFANPQHHLYCTRCGKNA
jgi:RsiW-degrading membrane proteinase PrsW (M82 family)